LTGLLSKQTFRLRYDTVFGLGKRDAGVTAILFSVKFDLLAEKLGHKAAVSVLKALGEYINTHLGALGAFSARQGRGKILTMLPHIDRSDADQLVEDFGRGLQEKALTRIKALTQARIGVDACFEIHISAGIVEARSNEAIEEIIERATSVQKVIAQYNCA
jgi:GGDEF domain-containing protein